MIPINITKLPEVCFNNNILLHLSINYFVIMKIAVPTRDGIVDNHFGHCDHYTIYTIEQGAIADTSTLPSPQGCGCKSNIASVLEQMGVTVMLAGNMGEGARRKLEEHNIRIIRGCSGAIDSVVKGYLLGFVFDSGIGCSTHHECSESH